MNKQRDTVFFAAINQQSLPIADEEVIIWNTAVVNPGGNYDNLTGAYTGKAGPDQIRLQRRESLICGNYDLENIIYSVKVIP